MGEVVLYYVTARFAFPGDESSRRERLLEKIAEAAHNGVDYVQLREKDLSTRELESLAREAVNVISEMRTAMPGLRTALLINSRTDVSLAVGADGVHLPASDISPDAVRTVWRGAAGSNAGKDVDTGFNNLRVSSASESLTGKPLIAVSCHSPQEVIAAATQQASFAVFGPVFEKQSSPSRVPLGLEALRHACRAGIPVLALGGISLKNARSCLEAGAAGIAAIRLFQENDIAAIVRELRG